MPVWNGPYHRYEVQVTENSVTTWEGRDWVADFVLPKIARNLSVRLGHLQDAKNNVTRAYKVGEHSNQIALQGMTHQLTMDAASTVSLLRFCIRAQP